MKFGRITTVVSVTCMFITLGACGKKSADYGDITPIQTDTKLPNLTYDSNNTNDDTSVIDNNNPEDRLIMAQNMDDLLDRFYKLGVKVEDGHSFITKVNYEGLHQLRSKLDSKYMKMVEAIRLKIENPSALEGKSESYKKAFLINAYNFNIIQIIVRNLMKNGKKIESIRDIRGRLDFDQNTIFKQKDLLKVAGNLLSFEQLENRILEISPPSIPNTKDSRVIFALAKGCQTCAVLLDEAYREKKLEEQLNEITRLSMRLTTMVSNDHVNKITNLNQMFKWNKGIFEQEKVGGIAPFMQLYGILRTYDNLTYLPFDWNLNQIGGAPVPINTGDIPIITAPKENPCLTFMKGTNFKSLASCQKVVNGQTSSAYKYTTELAHLCVLSKTDANKQTTIKVVGRLEEYDDRRNDQEVRLDLSTTEYKMNQRTGILSYRHKAREISDIEYDTQRMELKVSQRFRFWSLDMFKKKQQRSFILSCVVPE
ncbi:MAG: DUF547 domain-containing protein [Bdellovibrio sp.]|nr:DUF547 domain-containing protein [Bdellovibrio sp.]